jgi:hypothetical protein
VDLVTKKCEDCDLVAASFGRLAEGKKRWCFGCAKAHKGAVNVVSKKCEDCQLKQPCYRRPADGNKWCLQ